MVKPPGRCIFCGRHGLSKEHIWSEWTYKLVPKHPNAEREILLIQESPISHTRSVKKHPGSSHSVRLRKVCRHHCNSGWMSGLDDATQPILTPLILGEPTTLDVDAQQIVAAWLAMKIMVAEFSRPVDVSTTQAERQFLMRERKPPERWKIWLGQLSGEWWRTAYYRHSATIGLASGPTPPVRPLGKNTGRSPSASEP